MRKIMKAIVATIFLVSLAFVGSPKTLACVNWCDPRCEDGAMTEAGCSNYLYECGDDRPCGGIIVVGTDCPSGTYACNRVSDNYCCPVGGPGSGGGTAECTGRTDGCAPGWSPAPNMLLPGVNPNPYCRRPTYCPSPGDAQIQTGCCNYDYTDPDHPEGICITPEFKSVQCCPPGTAETPSTTTGGTYVRYNTWPTETKAFVCNDADDQYISHVNVDCRDIERENEPDVYDTRCNYNTTCRTVTTTYSCVSTCNATAPSAVLTSAGPNIGTSINISWTIGANGWGQLFWVDEDFADVDNGCPTVGDCEATSWLTETVNSQTVYGLQPLTMYYYRIVTYQTDACQKDIAGSFTTPASSGAISGIVYLDASNTCDETSTLNNVNVVLDGVTTDNTDPAGAFSFTGLALNSSHSLAVSLTNGYICSTSPACSAYPCTVGGVVSPDSSRRFYLTQNQGAWWQAEGATIYAGGSTGVTIGSTIPASIPDLDRYLIVGGALGSLSSGSLLRSSATTASLGAGGASVEGYQARTTYRGKRTDYSYFKNEMGLLSTTDSLLNLDTKPTDGAAFHYIDHATTLGDSLGTPWTVEADEKYVIFVNGNLDINVDITVAPGGFAAFIVNGSINVSPEVENIQGMFVANQNFNTVSNGTVDTQLTVEGSVVAWGDVSLDRDLVANNSNSPAEKFVYRPDLLISMPDEMKSFVMQWSEVVPGTYDE